MFTDLEEREKENPELQLKLFNENEGRVYINNSPKLNLKPTVTSTDTLKAKITSGQKIFLEENSEIFTFAVSLVYDFDIFVDKKACIGLDWI